LILAPTLFEAWMMKTVVTFDGAPPPGTINFGVGQPSADLLPVDLVRQASESFFAEAQPFDLNYGVPRGDRRFLDALADFLSRYYGTPATPETLFVTGGNSQAMSLVSTVYANPGDTVFVEEPSYFLAFKIFRDHDLNIVGIPMDDDGPNLEALEQAITKHKPAFFYTIPSYHNPTGLCSSAARRKEVVALAKQHDFLVIADEPYQLLHYYDEPAAAYGAMIDSDVVISLGSYSKILAPAMRLGWLQASENLIRKILTIGLIHSGGCINHISSHIARHAMTLGLIDSHIDKLRGAYRARLEAMEDALRDHFKGIAEWTRPDGGYFFWLQLDESIDTAPLKDKALAAETGFTAGSLFSGEGELRNYLRLSFAHYNEDDIRRGIARLRTIF
jgi:DNA-binding transcriptional MocR family regulator